MQELDALQNSITLLIDDLRKTLDSSDYSYLLQSIIESNRQDLELDFEVLPLISIFRTSLNLNKTPTDNYAEVLQSSLKNLRDKTPCHKIQGILSLFAKLKFQLQLPFDDSKIELADGEEILWTSYGIANCTRVLRKLLFDGQIILTNYRLIFLEGCTDVFLDQSTQENASLWSKKYHIIPLGQIMHFTKMNDSKMVSKVKRVLLITRDVRILKLGFISGSHRRKEMFIKLREYFSNMPRSLFCWSAKDPSAYVKLLHTTNRDMVSRSVLFEHKQSLLDGWTFYDVDKEFERMGVSKDNQWTCTMTNDGYKLCPTYPKQLWVPAGCTAELLMSASAFRSRNRLPALVYYHKSSKSVIMRSSQPAVGISRRRSREDELLLTKIQEANPITQELVIFDARPKVNAVANKAIGYGYEDVQNYGGCKLVFCDIENIHTIRNSLIKLYDAILDEESSRHNLSVQNSAWVSHQYQLFSSAVKIAKTVALKNQSVLVHCSDGWDRTTQLVSLTSIMLDPYYRTLNGFVVLIEKDWISFGHQFSLRHGYDGSSSSERAPIFQQFIETVWQTLHLFPKHFEFNENFLIFLLDQIYSCYFGTFLYNSQKERVEAKLSQQTLSLWDVILFKPYRSRYINRSYVPYNSILIPNINENIFVLWDNYYFRYTKN
ncbi:myotubularin-like [Schistocerca gregaria]|uniref:myotubularin-like n=1 Tax=Schistocerca gregaria TaxID=7010 RepID=UPI00211DAE08|nr:myotubularin-like [Schistocerca gregaria]